jgi:S-DNA-T family DNA segregation ATPase FtsK/SpoIIIE
MPLSPRHRRELIAIVALVTGLFVGLALLPLDFTGPGGRALGRLLLTGLGAGAVVVPVFGVVLGFVGLGRRGGQDGRDGQGGRDLARVTLLCGGLVLLVPYAFGVVAGVTSAADFAPDWIDWTVAQKAVGVVPGMIVIGVRSVIGTAGAAALGLVLLSALTIVTMDWHPFRRAGGRAGRRAVNGGPADGRVGGPTILEPVESGGDGAGAELVEVEPRRSRARKVPPAGPPARPPDDHPPVRPSARPPAAVSTELPPLDLLDRPIEIAVDSEAEIERMGKTLMETLATFRVDGTIAGRTTGPVVTQFEVAPAPGVKVNRIAALADDLALAMRAQSIRIVAPIPGKAAVGVEVPNPTARIVKIRELLEAPEWARARGDLPVVLGRDLEGRPIVADLARMPHLLIAGATGSGKSVCINTIITSLVYRYTPRELRMLMIDPKMVELAGYNAIPHLRHAVVTNNRAAAQTLKWAVYEMERRYGLFSANGAKNIKDLNKRAAEGKEMVLPRGSGEWGVVRSQQPSLFDTPAPQGRPPSEGRTPHSPLPYTEGALPYIVLFVDELADLMMTVQGEVERPLALLAQKARATGIHIILATQRPSVNVVTGLIKANFPCRIAFRVASKVDSRTILDQNGAEALLGNGDMLFLPPGKSEPVRLQGAFISTEETERLTEWYTAQKKRRDAALAAEGLLPPEAVEEDILAVIQAQEEAAEGGGASEAAAAAGERDPLFRDAAETCIQHQLGSTSLLQRKLRIGYGRAARIIDQLYEAGILGPPDGSKPREVLIGMEQLDEYCQ